eukprot:scaffold16110_cov148-Isochrysis_galbana.AAC.7
MVSTPSYFRSCRMTQRTSQSWVEFGQKPPEEAEAAGALSPSGRYLPASNRPSRRAWAWPPASSPKPRSRALRAVARPPPPPPPALWPMPTPPPSQPASPPPCLLPSFEGQILSASKKTRTPA